MIRSIKFINNLNTIRTLITRVHLDSCTIGYFDIIILTQECATYKKVSSAH